MGGKKQIFFQLQTDEKAGINQNSVKSREIAFGSN